MQLEVVFYGQNKNMGPEKFFKLDTVRFQKQVFEAQKKD